jgi:hypothetical protein
MHRTGLAQCWRVVPRVWIRSVVSAVPPPISVMDSPPRTAAPPHVPVVSPPSTPAAPLGGNPSTPTPQFRSVDALNAHLTHLCTSDRYMDACAVLMGQVHVHPTPASYHVLVAHALQHGDLAAALSLFVQMRAKRMPSLVRTHFDIITTALELDQVAVAEKLTGELLTLSIGLWSDTALVHRFLSHIARYPCALPWCLLILQRVSVDFGVVPFPLLLVTWRGLVRVSPSSAALTSSIPTTSVPTATLAAEFDVAAARASLWASITAQLDDYTACSQKLSASDFEAIIGLLCAHQQYPLALRVFRTMVCSHVLARILQLSRRGSLPPLPPPTTTTTTFPPLFCHLLHSRCSTVSHPSVV